MKIYVFPKAGEMPKEGDEYLIMLGVEWCKVPKICIKPYTEQDEGFVRRPLKMVSQTELIEELERPIPKHVLCGSEHREESPCVALYRQVIEQREEILIAFIAKYGISPERCIQVESQGRWSVREMTDEEIKLHSGKSYERRP